MGVSIKNCWYPATFPSEIFRSCLDNLDQRFQDSPGNAIDNGKKRHMGTGTTEQLAGLSSPALPAADAVCYCVMAKVSSIMFTRMVGVYCCYTWFNWWLGSSPTSGLRFSSKASGWVPGGAARQNEQSCGQTAVAFAGLPHRRRMPEWRRNSRRS